MLACQAAYKGLVEHTDGLIGRARAAFDVFTQNRGTPALFGYLSDHGDTVGEHGIYGKKSFFEVRPHPHGVCGQRRGGWSADNSTCQSAGPWPHRV